jgi:hypothetical protein
MNDFSVSSLHESRNEWGSRLVTILTPLVIDGFKSILDESIKLCDDNNESDKYLMTFQNLISRIPKWNNTIIEGEKTRICNKSGCVYLEDLLTCVHILQLKILTAVRVGQKQKKIEMDIPKLDEFIHRLYINVARKIYKNVYLYQLNIPPLQVQKHNREIEIIVQECIMNTLRESIPVEKILQAYMGAEEEVVEEIKEEIPEEVKRDIIKAAEVTNVHPVTNSSSESMNENVGESMSANVIEDMSEKNNVSLTFDDKDYVKDQDNNVIAVEAPKSIERLQKLSEERQQAYSDDNQRLQISDQTVDLNALDVHVIGEPDINIMPELLFDDIEILE